MLPAELERAARKVYVERQLLARRAVLATGHAWSQVDPSAIRASWRSLVGPAVLQITSGAQWDAASTADASTRALTAAQGLADDPAGLVDPAMFSGIASDGRDLPSLLETSNVIALRQIGFGATPAQALSNAGSWLQMTVGTQVADAGRTASGVATASRRNVSGQIRMLTPPSCSRCAVLGGRWYRWDAGFERHPRCDCIGIPAGEDVAGDARTDARQAIIDGQVSGLSRADTKAIIDGADPARVINAHRGMYTADAYGQQGLKATTERASRSGLDRGVPRLRPETIYRLAAGDRDEALRLLKRFGYIT
jgi:hypothetical protein